MNFGLSSIYFSYPVDEEWNRIRDVTYMAASDTLGIVISKHRDWFDDQDTEVNALLQSMHTTHLAYINKHSLAMRTAYCRAKQRTQVKLREMKNRWWQATAELLQMAADRHDTRHSMAA